MQMLRKINIEGFLMFFPYGRKLFAILLCLGLALAVTGADKDVMAVHDFKVSNSLKKLDVGGWWMSEKMENELAQTGKFRIVTRARIARVLKERNISSGPTLKPEKLGEIVGAQYIVTGQADYSGGKLIVVANIIDTTKKAGEIMESYDASAFSSDVNVKAKITELLDYIAKRMAMSPGEFLDLGISFLKQGDFDQAGEVFRDLAREVKIPEISALANQVRSKGLESKAMAVDLSGLTAGQALDRGLELLNKGEKEQASLIFFRLQKAKMSYRLADLARIALDGKRQKEKVLEQIIAEARGKFQNAVVASNEKDKQKDPVTLCDEAVTVLRAFLSNPKVPLSKKEQAQISALIGEIESFRKKLFAGPSSGRGWTVPGVKIEMVPVSAGAFSVTRSRGDNENSVAVKITRSFWIGKYEVSAGQYMYYLKSQSGLNRNERFAIDKEILFLKDGCPLKRNYSLKRGYKENHPMAYVSWRGAKNFCVWLTDIERKAGRLPEGYEYRLPTEAEWEYCSLAGSTKAFCFGDDAGKLGDYASYNSNSNGRPEKCGSKKPNAWGIFDMHGNVWEWCNDWFGETSLAANTEDPLGPEDSNDNTKVLKGGSFRSSTGDLMSSARYSFDYKSSKNNMGFRVVCGPEL